MEFIARTDANGKPIQSVQQHLLEVSRNLSIFGKAVGMPQTGKLIGLLHDIGHMYCHQNILPIDVDENDIELLSLINKKLSPTEKKFVNDSFKNLITGVIHNRE